MNKVKNFFKNNWMYIGAGIVIGVVAFVLTLMGNPANMGFCIACFLRDTAGALKLHSAAVVQYARPEIIGIVLGAFAISLLRKDFKPTGGSAPVTRFLLGMIVMIGALVFLGCPLRMVLRIGGGDLNAIIALLGFIGGIAVGVVFLNLGFTLRRSYDLPKLEAAVAPASSAFLLIILIGVPSLLVFSETGPASMRAPIYAALIGGLIVGAIGQRTRACFVGGIRDSMMFRQFHMVYMFVAVILTTIICNAFAGKLHFSFNDQPVAHSDFLWNFLGMAVVGLGSVFLGGCPFRQLVLSGSGNSDSTIAVLGMIAGAALAHNWGLASAAASATAEGGATDAGMIAIGVCIVLLLVIGFCNRKKVS